MGWVERAFEKRKAGGLRVSYSVPLGVNPFKDLWDKFFGNKTIAGGGKRGKYSRILPNDNGAFKNQKGGH